MELDELEAAGGLVDTGGGHGRHVPQREHGLNPGALVGAAQSMNRGEAEWSNNSSVRVRDQERHENELRGWL